MEEDRRLMNFIINNGIQCWRMVPKLAGFFSVSLLINIYFVLRCKKTTDLVEKSKDKHCILQE